MTAGDHQRRCWIVSGRVQGVSFRAFVQRHARRLGVTGYAQNLDDGDVRVYAEGTSDALSVLRRQIGKGPRHARVRFVRDAPIQEVNAPPQRGFAIR